MSAMRINNSIPARTSPTRAADLALARVQAWKAYPVQNGGLAKIRLGPSRVRGCPQQNKMVKPMPAPGSTREKASAAQPESGPHRDNSPASPPPRNIISINSISSVSCVTIAFPYFFLDLCISSADTSRTCSAKYH
jgi:hypothetical protein